MTPGLGKTDFATRSETLFEPCFNGRSTSQFIDQPIELIERSKLDAQLAQLFHLAQAFDAFFYAHLHLGHEQVRQLFLDSAHIA